MARSRALARRPAVHTGPLKETQRRFLKAYVSSGTIRDAAIAAKVGRQTHYDWLEQHETYQQAFQAAKDEAVEGLEAECRKRALRRSDVLLIFLLTVLVLLPVPARAAQMEPAVVLDQLRELDPALASALKQALQPSPPARGPRSPALVQLGLLAVLGGWVAVASSQGRVGLAAMGAGVVCIVVGGMEVQANPSIVTVRVRW